MSSIFTDSADPTLSKPAARWIALTEEISVCGRMLRDEVADRTARWQLSWPEFSILWACREASAAGLGQKELAAVLAVSAAQVSGLVERLRRQRFLEGRRDRPDRRRQLWRLTPEGWTTLQEVLADLTDWAGSLDDQIAAGRIESGQIGSGRCDALSRLLEHLAEVLRDRTDGDRSLADGPRRKGAA